MPGGPSCAAQDGPGSWLHVVVWACLTSITVLDRKQQQNAVLGSRGWAFAACSTDGNLPMLSPPWPASTLARRRAGCAARDPRPQQPPTGAARGLAPRPARGSPGQGRWAPGPPRPTPRRPPAGSAGPPERRRSRLLSARPAPPRPLNHTLAGAQQLRRARVWGVTPPELAKPRRSRPGPGVAAPRSGRPDEAGCRAGTSSGLRAATDCRVVPVRPWAAATRPSPRLGAGCSRRRGAGHAAASSAVSSQPRR